MYAHFQKEWRSDMATTRCLLFAVTLIFVLVLLGCNPNPQVQALTPIPTLAPGATVTLVPAVGERSVSESAPVPVPTSQSAGALGAHIFEKNCTTCHGIHGEGVDAPPLRNNEYIETGDEEAVFNTIVEGRAGTEMPAWFQENGGPLTAGEITEVLAYLHTLQGVPSVPPAPQEEEKAPEPTPEPNAPPARPSNPGESGPAASMAGDAGRGQPLFGLYCAPCHGPQGVQGIPNPGSDDGAVPELNPIDPTIVNPDAAVFATNVDLFIEHGSVPEGGYPRLLMPAFGDHNLLQNQQIADLIAYLIQIQQENPSE
jgi:mono/diheme cytochrome c family protein